MAEAYIVDAARTAGGRRNGKLAGWHPADLGGEVLNALVDRTGVDPAAIDDVIMLSSPRSFPTACRPSPSTGNAAARAVQRSD
jgi:acetyl-CoA acetyltransferase